MGRALVPLALIVCVLAATLLTASAQTGFISLACGLPDGGNVIDQLTGLTYNSDSPYIHGAGVPKQVSPIYITYISALEKYSQLRSFPTGVRNCYTLPVSSGAGQRFLLRVFFFHGSYDGTIASLSNPVKFDLNIGVDSWKTVAVTDSRILQWSEVIGVALSGSIDVCLVKTGSSTPFITALEYRPLDSSLYTVANSSHYLNMQFHHYMSSPLSSTSTIIRYPDDSGDRIWVPYQPPGTLLTKGDASSVFKYHDGDEFRAPQAALRTAASPLFSRALTLPFPADPKQSYYSVFFMAEVLDPGANDSRSFDVYFDGIRQSTYIQITYPFVELFPHSSNFVSGRDMYNLTFVQRDDSTLPPIFNAYASYSSIPLVESTTDAGQASAISAIRDWYKLGVSKSWTGDPCSPEKYTWAGLQCELNSNFKYLITSVNLTGSGLSGEIIDSFALLGSMTTLDLSSNSLSGPIPDFLANISSLKILDLQGNQFTGGLPPALKARMDEKLITIRLEGITPTPAPGNSTGLSKTYIVIIAVVGFVILVALVIVIVLLIVRRNRKPVHSYREGQQTSTDPIQGQQEIQVPPVTHARPPPVVPPQSDNFTYSQVNAMTGGFSRVISRDKFGMVYSGKLPDGSSIVVKRSGNVALYGTAEFIGELKRLTEIRHRNLVRLYGYCVDKSYVCLVFEYVSEASVNDHLAGKAGFAKLLSWPQRMQMALDVAKGLDYLHTGCHPPIIHGGIKSTTILVSENAVAVKIADLGLSRPRGGEAADADGYTDPQYQQTWTLNEKSDVYSFGVVLLELITGEPPFMPGRGDKHVTVRVLEKIEKGIVDEVIDGRIQSQFDKVTAWRVVDLALACTSTTPANRPAMSDVVGQLKSCIPADGAEAQRREGLYAAGSPPEMSTSVVREYNTTTFAPKPI